MTKYLPNWVKGCFVKIYGDTLFKCLLIPIDCSLFFFSFTVTKLSPIQLQALDLAFIFMLFYFFVPFVSTDWPIVHCSVIYSFFHFSSLVRSKIKMNLVLFWFAIWEAMIHFPADLVQTLIYGSQFCFVFLIQDMICVLQN